MEQTRCCSNRDSSFNIQRAGAEADAVALRVSDETEIRDNYQIIPALQL